VVAIESVHLRKSAALIAVAVVGGARLGGADEATLGRLREFGLAVGLAFQIADDLIDSVDGEKPDGACSLVRAIGAEAARIRAEALLQRALVLVEGLGVHAEALRELARFAVRREQ
jgi:geranylgeranyl pyrophosphate synthase